MFLGEFSCLAAFYLLVCRDRRRAEPSLAPAQPFNPLLFLPPALCDMTGTSIMYVGDLLIIMAQVIVAIQMVLEEKFIYKHDVHPLRAVGTEGRWQRGGGALGGGAPYRVLGGGGGSSSGALWAALGY
ncbi:Transmembrane protein C2orf18 like protein [Chelonia mydas]|uniref:Transmembrane protein C2orf18 like protein n=1 Tax=Chelonia mydas TaxID=8469 RepID=M7B9J4_CHEMY|nr:Transmembrane protein C2orf18 like protein [Chelonia mydas]